MRLARAIIADLIGAIKDVDPRMHYVNAQIDRATLAEARKFITEPQPELDWDVSLIRTALRRYVSPWSSEEEEALDRLAALAHKAPKDESTEGMREELVDFLILEYSRGISCQKNAFQGSGRRCLCRECIEARAALTQALKGEE